MSFTNSATYVPNTLSQNDESITNPIKIASFFNEFFCIIAAKSNSKVKLPKEKKHFSDFLKTKNLDTFFIYPVTKEEICNIISPLNSNKTIAPISIPVKILKLL